MDFILQHDWLHRGTDSKEFLTEASLDKSNLHRIITGTFRDPLLSEDESEEDQKHDIDALLQSTTGKTSKNEQKKREFVPGLRPLPQFPRQSSMTLDQHAASVRVLSELDRSIGKVNTYRITNKDRKFFEEIHETYEKEKKEFIEWAASLWVSRQCLKVLRPSPLFERLYEAERLARCFAVTSLPVSYEFAAQIDMSRSGDCEFDKIEDLKKVDMSKLPTIVLPSMDVSQSISKPIPNENFPRSCHRHPCRIVLPDESRNSTLPLRELNTELAKLGARRGAACVASERALRCLGRTAGVWCLPVTVEYVLSGDEYRTVVVLSDEVQPRREPTRCRAARALHLLLRRALVRESATEQLERDEESNDRANAAPTETPDDQTCVDQNSDDSESDDENRLCIDTGEHIDEDTSKCKSGWQGQTVESTKKPDESASSEETITRSRKFTSAEESAASVSQLSHECTCKGTPFERPPQMSYKKWLLKKKGSDETIPIVVHSSHKHKTAGGVEAILNALPEYQPDIAGCAPDADALRSVALALRLRENATVISARVDATSGQLITFEHWDPEYLRAQYASHSEGRGPAEEAMAAVYNALSQLCRLKPGHYVLQHEPKHGHNALLYVGSQSTRSLAAQSISLAPSDANDEEMERKHLQTPPVLSDVLLPMHRFRRFLPLAFSPYPPLKKRVLPTREERKRAAIQQKKKEKNATKKAKMKEKRKAKRLTGVKNSKDK